MFMPIFINGEFRETKEKQPIISPATGEAIAEVSVAGADDVEAAIAGARRAFDSGGWTNLPLQRRRTFLLNLASGILDHAEELAQIETLNTGKPIKESTFMDIPSASKAFSFLVDNFEKYLQEESPQLEEGAICKLLREPLGVVALIVPWNYPLLIACWKLASALAAGNTVILKPSSLTPLSALWLAKIIRAADFPSGVVNIIHAGGEKIGQQLCSDPRVDMISFTGSNAVGKKIIEYASGNVKKMVMELGGKSAAVVFSDANLDVAVNSCLSSIFLNQGQMCTAMSRILVEDKIYEQFVRDFCEKAKRIKIGPGESSESQIGPLISERQRQKVIDFVKAAQEEGAKIACGGNIPQDPALADGFFFEPTVLTQVTPGMKIFRQEVFGPVACIIPFRDEQEALLIANDSDYGLACSIWTSNKNLAGNIAKKINAGTVWINTYGMFYNSASYGGFKQSGFGKELGKEGFLEYTRLKNIVTDQSADGKPLVSYWYGF